MKKIQQVFAYPFSTFYKYYVYFPMKGEVVSVDKEEYYAFLLLTKENTTKENLFNYLKGKTDISIERFNKLYGFLKVFLKGKFLKFPEYTVNDVRKEIDQILFNLKKEYLKGRIKSDSLTLHITEKCNLRCSYCFFNGKFFHADAHARNISLSLATAQKAIKDFLFNTRNSREKEISVIFFGGEPLVEFSKIKELIFIARKYHQEIKHKSKLKMLVVTNAVLLNKELIAFFINNKIKLQISLDGPQEIHDKYRRGLSGEGTYKKVMDNIKMIKILAFRMHKENYYFENVSFNSVYVDDNDKERIASFFKTNKLFKYSKGKKFVHNDVFVERATFDNALDGVLEKINKNQEKKEDLTPLEQWTSKIRGIINVLKNKKSSLEEKKEAKVQLWEFYERMSVFKIKKPSLKLAVKTRFGCIPCGEKGGGSVDSRGNIGFCPKIAKIYGNPAMFAGNYYKNGIDFEKIGKLMFGYASAMKKCFKCPFLMMCTICYKEGIKGVDGKKCFYKNPLENPTLCVNKKKSMAERFYIFYSVLDGIPEIKEFQNEI